jgi:outer membrane protein assembly factor BamB
MERDSQLVVDRGVRHHWRLGLCRLALLLVVCVCGGVAAEEWQWADAENNGRNGVLPAVGLPDHVGEENLIWKVPIRARWHFCQPTASAGKVFLGMSPSGIEDEALKAACTGKAAALVCLDLRTGERLWEFATPNALGTAYGVCSPPVVDGDRLYMRAGTDALCLDVNGQADGNDGPFLDELDYFVKLHWQGHVQGEPLSELRAGYGDIIWVYHMRDLGVKTHDAGAGTPVLDDDLLWVPTSHARGVAPTPAWTKIEDDGKWQYQPVPNLVGLDKRTGRLVAKDDLAIPRIFHSQWSSPSLGEVNGRKLIFYGDGYGFLHAFARPNPEAGEEMQILEEVWRLDCNPPEYRCDENGEEIPYPRHETPKKYEVLGLGIGPCEIIGAAPVFWEDRVYVAIGRDRAYNPREGRRVLGGGHLLCIDPTGSGDITETGTVWSTKDVGRTQSTVSIVDGLLYLADLYGHLHCFDAETGERYWRHDLESMVKERTQIVADGKIYVADDANQLWVLKAGKELEVLSTSERLDGEPTSVTAVDGMLLIGTPRSIAGYGLSAAAPTATPDERRP